MSVPNTRPLERRPVHPGEILREDFFPDYGLTVSDLATAIGVSRQSVNELVRERRAVSAEMALRLAAYFDNAPEYWLNLQRAVDLYDARLALAPRSVARSVTEPGTAVRSEDAAASMAALAAKVLQDPRASRIQKRLAAAALAKTHRSKRTQAEAEREAARILRGKRYADATRKLAAAVMARPKRG
jgi:addiction module HigA family antidote